MDTRHRLAFAAILVLAVACYLPGLSSGFLFDDFVNLDALGNRGPIDTWPAFWRYLTSGSADPLGRPLSLLTFLLDARDWPADPAPFLRTNLLIHLLNAALLFRLLLRIEPRHDDRHGMVAALAAGLWVLHPLLVSTTLYVVQREAMLPATCVLLALNLFAWGRQRFAASNGRTGFAAMATAILAGTLFASLAKANGMLLPVLAWVLAATVLRSTQEDSGLHPDVRARLAWFDRFALTAPSLCIGLYLLAPLLHWNEILHNRPWTIGQRVLTEPRVLLHYIDLLVMPRVLSPGLFNEQLAASRDILHPATTLPALLAIAAAIAIALALRVRRPRLAAAMLFFFGAQALESSTVPLELYFEHRNYLPSMLLAWPLAHAIVYWRAPPPVRFAVAVGLLVMLGTITWQRASLWGQPGVQARIWALNNPQSARAQATAAMALLDAGQPQRAASLLLPLWRDNPGELQLAFNYASARCAGDGLDRDDIELVRRALASAQGSQLLANQWLGRAMATAVSGSCRGLTLDAVGMWLQAAEANISFGAPGVREQDLFPLLGELALYRQQDQLAAQLFGRALQSHPNPDFAARLVSTLASHGRFAAALALLDAYERMHVPAPKPSAGMAWVHWQVMQRQGFWEHEFATLRAKLEADLAADRQHDRAPGHAPGEPR
jgi:tetratricopeptide (TPR) repeat protein